MKNTITCPLLGLQEGTWRGFQGLITKSTKYTILSKLSSLVLLTQCWQTVKEIKQTKLGDRGKARNFTFSGRNIRNGLLHNNASEACYCNTLYTTYICSVHISYILQVKYVILKFFKLGIKLIHLYKMYK